MRIGIIGAMDEEIALYKEGMELIHESRKAGITYYEGRWEDREVVLCKCGVGKVNASVCTQILVDTFQVGAVIFTGVAGALHPELEIGDIVVSTDCQHHDMDVTALGFPRGVIPFTDISIFRADKQLIDAAVKASEHAAEGKTMTGRILSGDQFIASRDTVRELHETMAGMCTEMEGAAVAQVCVMNEIPFVVIRSMSDKADGSAHVNFPEFTKLASQRSYEIVSNMLLHL
ncbi:5'-methylthioadenosine/adenosylhomocysteine nucleosidase [Aneurinibacillus aneurinilyticus]|jgi:adenosylhomocysteine nucleosidase|uniref:adenosylhomocysteine nucleosidase n=2 Tax=Aneurinibacillus aneurinilyticus TaxID=1391 RepID=A0A848CZV2_ANEAE|nr:5'-methylthioadenosine/adenosylhomocysteine nucleosidase [Aneurinibacillus aneurinilyticus]ERI04090.1 MTA/SAH nucleosidase [Aneurinibacillus aneurinilyticus ATCC 12856]MCI1692486.1 5'-methylthioadenosine/adenosylhomocysteine nucleosidase [Aneurinibacillus aneurinilyticus]MED0707828.1 5'-methylthioadenosine/adenosylhomocysteine nucleosidase [Aneurinibacillus aneurinilyticus]MED0722985.1 5'-methylthioadenosine/adenosylhomocysteine nucleosidase [Aneurinibacillus aneurinilyticus]MED0734682.1 5'